MSTDALETIFTGAPQAKGKAHWSMEQRAKQRPEPVISDQ